MKVVTIFRVNGELYRVEGAGQETVKAIKAQFPRNTSIVLRGFEINNVFHKMYL